MISPILAKLYGIILEKKINIRLKYEGKWTKDQKVFRRNHSTMDHLVMLRIIKDEFHNSKSNLSFCFVDFRKAFDTMPRNNLWNKLEDPKVHFMLRVVAIRLYESVKSKFKNAKGCSKDINCTI